MNLYCKFLKLKFDEWANKFLVGVLLLLCVQTANGSHNVGGEITYRYIGSNQYEINYTLYRDCNGVAAPDTIIIGIRSASCGITLPDAHLSQVFIGDVEGCICESVPTTCQGGTFLGIQKVDYRGTIILPVACPDWNFWVTDCCLPAAVSSMFNPSNTAIYVEAYLNNVNFSNSSPSFFAPPPDFIFIGQDNTFNPITIDTVENDSLVYAFIAPRQDQNLMVSYSGLGYSIASPITSNPPITVNHSTGTIDMHPTTQEVGVMAMLVLEYHNGSLVGSVMRESLLITTNNTDSLPEDSSSLGVNIRTATISASSPTQICFTIYTTDDDAGDSLQLVWNNGIPGAIFTVTPGFRPSGTFCWMPVAGDVRPQPYHFQIFINDGHCPYVGLKTFEYSIYVIP